MKLIDLEIHVQNWRKLNKTRRIIHVYLNEADYRSILNENISDLPKEIIEKYEPSIGHSGFFIFPSINIKYSNHNTPVEINYCYINADCGSDISKVLDENERIIKDIIE